MLYVCVFFVISMDMLLFSLIIIEKVYLKNDVVLFFLYAIYYENFIKFSGFCGYKC